MGKYCTVCGCNLNDPVNESSPEADLCSVCGGPRIRNRPQLKLVGHDDQYGYICWHSDPVIKAEMNGFSSAQEFNILQVFPDFEGALEELLDWDQIPEGLSRREMINFVDEKGWRIKKVKVSFTDSDRETQIAAWLKACVSGKIHPRDFIYQVEKLFS